ncbi:MAG: phosphopantetheine-binding protein [Oscillospiraceae bacterium]|nr:phosphopantetheine-binding protein [Oscillospiraceae bacterium]
MIATITEILREYKGIDNLTITEDTTFESLELDSLDTVELVMSLEEAFGITIELDQKVTTIADLMRVIEKAQQAEA